VPTDDSPNTVNVRCSDKWNDKLSDKPDGDLVEIVAVWPDLPKHIKAAIKALIQAHKGEET